MKLFLVEDNEKMREECAVFLRKYDFEVVAPAQFDHIVEDILGSQAHLVLLDINLPVYDGYFICREVRKSSDIPIIVLTSRDSQVDELMSMNLGADDFIAKPYHPQILLARITSLLNRTYQKGGKTELVHKGLELDFSRSMARGAQGGQVELSKNEVRILHLLMRNGGKIVSREELMNDLWQSDEFVDDNTLTVNINRLRKKLSDIGLGDYIETKRGQGYLV